MMAVYRSFCIPLLLATALVNCTAAESFYDNPEQDPVRRGSSTVEELQKQWGFEVSLTATISPGWRTPINLLPVGLQRDINLRPPEACEVLDGAV